MQFILFPYFLPTPSCIVTLLSSQSNRTHPFPPFSALHLQRSVRQRHGVKFDERNLWWNEIRPPSAFPIFSVLHHFAFRLFELTTWQFLRSYSLPLSEYRPFSFTSYFFIIYLFFLSSLISRSIIMSWLSASIQ